MEPMEGEATSGLGKKTVGKINELIGALVNDRKADAAWKHEAVRPFEALEREVMASRHGSRA